MELNNLTRSWPKRARNRITQSLGSETSLDQGRPSRIGGIARRRHAALVAAADVDRPDLRAAAALDGAAEHDNAAVRRPGRAFVLPAGGEDAHARAVGLHDSDMESAALIGKRDQIAARAPYRGAVAALPEADAVLVRAVGAHDIDLLAAAAGGFEGDLGT